MCGIAGIISENPSKITQPILLSMSAALAHRGPDGEAIWINENLNAGFAHRRLIIIDTSQNAAQPMHYLGRYTIIYNGEIYNYVELKNVLKEKGYSFNTNSDTEVILAAYDCYGSACVDHFDGMFAFALWDEEEQTLYCARDRFGEKPLFYYYDEANRTLYFASEMKALVAAGLERTPNNYMVLRYLAHGYTNDISDQSRTFDERFKKLPAAHYLTYSPLKNLLQTKRYWQIDKDTIIDLPVNEAAGRLQDLLGTSVFRRLRSDVPLGASLSGGLDSSAIVATIRRFNKEPFKTFTAVFPGYDKNEQDSAAFVAGLFGCDAFYIAPTAEGMVEEFEKMMYHQEEPVTSASVYAQFKIFECAKEHGVKVLLDGQGADETIGGYDKYKSWGWRALLPELTAEFLKEREDYLVNASSHLDIDFVEEYRDDSKTIKPVVRQLNDMLYFNTFQSGLEELLRYADRNSMAHGREVRLPFLNAELVSFIFSLPSSFKVHSGWTKWILRVSMDAVLPREIVWNRKKVGFEPPQRTWMENKGMIDYIFEAKKKLVKKGMLSEKVLGNPPLAHDAYVDDGYDWRYVSLAYAMP